MNDEYVIQTTANQRIDILKDTEPALKQLEEARAVRAARENPGDQKLQLLDKEFGQLDSIAHEIQIRFGAFRHQIFEIGRLFYEAREILKKSGEEPFGSWVERNFKLSGKTATNYMRVYHCCMGKPEVVAFFPPTAMYVICSDKFPNDLREALFEHAEGIIPPEKKELVEVALKLRNHELTMQSPEVQTILCRQRTRDETIIFTIEMKSLKNLVEGRRKRFEALARRKAAYPLISDGGQIEHDEIPEEGPRERIARLFENFTNDIDSELELLKTAD